MSGDQVGHGYWVYGGLLGRVESWGWIEWDVWYEEYTDGSTLTWAYQVGAVC